MRPSLLHDEQVYQEVVDNLARGVPQVLIAQSLGVSEKTLSGWKNRKGFKKDLALKTMQKVGAPIDKIAELQPLAYIERHPATRETWQPPKKVVEQTNTNIIQVFSGELLRRYEVIEVEARVIEPVMLPCDSGNME